MTLAGVIAAGGILTNNELLIVGAMIVSPDYGPVAGFCVAIIGRLDGRARSSAGALLVGFVVAALAAAVIGVVARLAGLVPDAYLAGDRPIAELISEPNVASFVVALAAGVAGIVALGQAKSRRDRRRPRVGHDHPGRRQHRRGARVRQPGRGDRRVRAAVDQRDRARVGRAGQPVARPAPVEGPGDRRDPGQAPPARWWRSRGSGRPLD